MGLKPLSVAKRITQQLIPIKMKDRMNSKEFTQFEIMDAIMKALIVGSQMDVTIDLNQPPTDCPEEIELAFEHLCTLIFKEKDSKENKEQHINNEIKNLLRDGGFSNN
jgi:hypothetical protein